ncbi:MAG: DUF550 domain-containing protein [Eubacteriales bacterium]|nr:DUF550 domain-containing protein [Eubacteriales bacterium]
MLSLQDMQDMQRALQDKHKGQWSQLTPQYGRSCLLWAVEEFGEVVSVIKKRGEGEIMHNPQVRAAFVEEFADVLMFLNDALLCYDISARELSAAYEEKHNRNMGRDWNADDKDYLPAK